ncbi:MAG: hypothetical protein GC160_13430 [Acidobacteria bacterium]|nr:hypothetical protein [Acidobacteriota bacterium]
MAFGPAPYPMSVATFAAQALADFQSTAAIVPSSRFLAAAMVRPLQLEKARTIVEFGPGTGAMTRALLRSMAPDARLIAFEVNPSFVKYLGEHMPDPRLTILERGAEEAPAALAELGVGAADAALSSLGLSLFPDSLTERILGGLPKILAPGAVFTQFQYVSRMRMVDGRPEYFDASCMIRRHFPVVERRLIVRNIPPAFVYIAHNRL